MNVRCAIAILVVGATLAACATTPENNPRQVLIWSAYHQCQAEGRAPNNIQVTRVEPDGRTWYSMLRSNYGWRELESCINEKVSPPPSYVPVVAQ